MGKNQKIMEEGGKCQGLANYCQKNQYGIRFCEPSSNVSYTEKIKRRKCLQN